MAVDVTFDPIAPNSANPEAAANTALTKFAAAITEIDGAQTAPAAGLPIGGTTGQILYKVSGTDYDADWEDPAMSGAEYPPGGTTGQILAKASNADNDVAWIDAPTGGGGGGGGGYVSYKAYRLKILNTADPQYTSVDNIEFRTTAGTPEPATGGMPYSSPTGNGATADQAFDGQNGARWVGQYPNPTYPKYIGYIYATPRALREVIIASAQNFTAEAPIAFDVEGSNDTTDIFNGTWTKLKSVTGLSWVNSETKTFAIDAPAAPSIGGGGSYNDRFSPPLLADFTVIVGTATGAVATDDPDIGFALKLPSQGNNLLKAYGKALPTSGNFEVIAHVIPNLVNGNYQSSGMTFWNDANANACIFSQDFSNSGHGIILNGFNKTASAYVAYSAQRVNSYNSTWQRMTYDDTTGLMSFYTSNDGKQWAWQFELASSAFGGKPKYAGVGMSLSLGVDPKYVPSISCPFFAVV